MSRHLKLVPVEPARICKFCGCDASHNDEGWAKMPRFPNLCFAHTVCPNCETALLNFDHKGITCRSCRSHWEDVAEFELDLVDLLIPREVDNNLD